jgi:hypothetical protein
MRKNYTIFGPQHPLLIKIVRNYCILNNSNLDFLPTSLQENNNGNIVNSKENHSLQKISFYTP